MIKLSICIPTYNFGRFIGETLDSILPQLTPEVELIVLDGGSTDNTSEVVRRKFETTKNFTYHRQAERGGIDLDIERVIGLARGGYCWLFSADDVMLPGSIKTVLGVLQDERDIYLCEHLMCDVHMLLCTEYPIFKTPIGPTKFDFTNSGHRKTYFEQARNSEAFFSFLSAPIFRRSIWDSAIIPDSFRETCWIVAGHLLKAVSQGATVDYMACALLLKRGENDSFADRGTVNRCRIAIEGLHHIADTIFGAQSEEAFHVKRSVRVDIPLRSLLKAKWKTTQAPALESRLVLDRIVKMHYANAGVMAQVQYAVYRLTPGSWIAGLLWIQRLMRRIDGVSVSSPHD